jgi:hypothetical protein
MKWRLAGPWPSSSGRREAPHQEANERIEDGQEVNAAAEPQTPEAPQPQAGEEAD